MYAPPAGVILAPGIGQTLSVTFTPTDTENYATATATVAIDVARAASTATVHVSDKPYDRTPNATLAQCTPTGVVGQDVVFCTGTAAFASQQVGTGKTVTVSGLTITGPDAGSTH